MADLPQDRVNASEPFTYCAVDMFGPFQIKDGRKCLKRYGALFTCLTSRAIHIESTNSLDTDSFINALRRMIARRGSIRLMRCDNGTNFIGAENELKKALKEMDQECIKDFMNANGADWIEWKHNPPLASHMGGVWERQIRTVRSILFTMLRSHGESLNDESYRTFLTEAESIVNSRPLAVDTINDPQSLRPLTPNHLLTMKSTIIMPPPGIFQKEDLYCRKRWRRVQHLLNEFWSRWKREYLTNLQTRSKWDKVKRNFKVGDIVLMKEDSKRCSWPMCRIIDCNTDKDGLVRSVKLITTNGTFERPINKLILLLEREEVDSPTKSQSELFQD